MICSVWGNVDGVKTLLKKSNDRHKRETTSSSTEDIDINLKAHDGNYFIFKLLYYEIKFFERKQS